MVKHFLKIKFLTTVIGGCFVVGGLILSVTLILAYILSFIAVIGETTPVGSIKGTLILGISSLALYVTGWIVWNTQKDTEPSITKKGSILFSSSLFLAGGITLLFPLFFSTRGFEIEESVRTSWWYMNFWFALIALALIGVGILVRIKIKREENTCPHCGVYLPEKVLVCPSCGKEITW
ncbi:MAG: zinc ribbon domain-containing protein [Candidatus Methanofastidiosia archaeon]|jgi:hypothetical protein